jgi:hypothetical protein
MVGSDKKNERKTDKMSPGQIGYMASGPSPIFVKSNSDKNISKDT